MNTPMYPMFLRLAGVRVCVVGGGAVAERKITSLLEADAVVRVVSPTVTETVRHLAENRRIEWVPIPFEPSSLDGCSLVFAATDDRNVNARVAELADERNVWVNVADSLEESSFVVPATVRRGALQIAVSTEGASPLLGRRIREELEARYGAEYETFCVLLAEARVVAKATLPSQDNRQRFFAALMDSEVLELIRQGDVEDARWAMLALLDARRDLSD